MSNLELHQLFAQADEARQNHQYSQAVEQYTAVLDKTDANTDNSEIRALRLAALREIGLLQRRSGQHDAALASYEQYHKEAKDSRQQVIAVTQIGQQFTSMGQYDQALAKHKEALQLAETLNYVNGRAQAFLGIGSTLFYLGDYEEATAQLKKALSLFMQINDNDNISRSWNWLGIIHLQQGEVDKSIAAYHAALPFAREMGELETSIVLNNIGEVHQSIFDMEQALIYHREGLELANKVAMPNQSIDVRRNLGVDLCYLGQLEEGIQYLQEALQTSKQYENKDMIMQTLYSLAYAQIENNQLHDAKLHADLLEKMAKADDLRGYHARALYILGLYHCANNEPAEAEKIWQQVLFWAHETGQKTLLWRVHAALANISENNGLAEAHNRIASEVIDQIVYPIEDDSLRQKFLNAPQIRVILDQVN